MCLNGLAGSRNKSETARTARGVHSRNYLAHLRLSRSGSVVVRLDVDGGAGVRTACLARIVAIPFHPTTDRYDAPEEVYWRYTTQRLAEDLSRFAEVHLYPSCMFKLNNFQPCYRKYGIREDHQYSEVLALCRFCCCLFWPSAGHPCIADQSPDFRARLKDAGSESDSQPVPPAQFLKYFSL